MNKARFQDVCVAEFNILIKLISEHGQSVDWDRELYLVMAAKSRRVRLSTSLIKSLLLYKSYFVTLNDYMADFYFDLDEDSLKHAGGTIKRLASNAVIDFFETNVRNVSCLHFVAGFVKYQPMYRKI